MDRDLRAILRHLVAAALPLGAAACGSDGPTGMGPNCGGGGTVTRVYVIDGGVGDMGCAAVCRALQDVTQCEPVVTDAGDQAVRCTGKQLCLGRRPARWLPAAGVAAAGVVGDYFARQHQFEAASVTAFRVLAAELRAHGAPARLVRAAERAARDEVRHARSAARLARRYGGRSQLVQVAPPTPRSLLDMAIENAVEGCVRESYGALVATYQGRAAADGAVRAALRDIARDETRHAELAWAVAAWADTRLGAATRARIAAARSAAAGALMEELADEPAPELARCAGLPSAAGAQALLCGLTRSLQV